MEHLLERVKSEFDDAEGWFHIVDANWYANDLRLDISIKMNDHSQAEIWEVSCEGVVEESINSQSAFSLFLNSTSNLLLPYLEDKVDLYFSNNHCNPATLLGVVLSCCVEVVGDASYIQRFLNLEPTVDGIVSAKHGKLGEFPKSLATAILHKLEKQSISINSLNERLPQHWNGQEYVNYPELVALKLGSSFIIANNFSASRA